MTSRSEPAPEQQSQLDRACSFAGPGGLVSVHLQGDGWQICATRPAPTLAEKGLVAQQSNSQDLGKQEQG